MGVYQGDYGEIVATLLLFQTKRIPVWFVSNTDIDYVKLEDLSVMNIYGAMRDWLEQHRYRISAVLSMLEDGAVDSAKQELLKMKQELDDSIFMLATISDTYQREVMLPLEKRRR